VEGKRRASERENEAHRIGLHNVVCSSGGNGENDREKGNGENPAGVNPIKVMAASRFST